MNDISVKIKISGNSPTMNLKTQKRGPFKETKPNKQTGQIKCIFKCLHFQYIGSTLSVHSLTFARCLTCLTPAFNKEPIYSCFFLVRKATQYLEINSRVSAQGLSGTMQWVSTTILMTVAFCLLIAYLLGWYCVSIYVTQLFMAQLHYYVISYLCDKRTTNNMHIN